MLNFFVSVWLKFFFVLTPFFALSMFLSMTREYSGAQQRHLAWRVLGAATVICLILFFFGSVIFALFGITLDAFRVGTGALLFLSSVTLIRNTPVSDADSPDHDIAVVPLAIPVIVGPATVGTLLVLGAEIDAPLRKAVGALALLFALATLGTILLLASAIERVIGRRGLNILSKVTGLVLAALAAQMMLVGIANFLG
ncbi:MAG: MarC family protein [Lentisphaerae bacterium]|jgi:multiple antibiotic resistance protein|nr:MarC family protein [Lentisphaerota bacterium]